MSVDWSTLEASIFNGNNPNNDLPIPISDVHALSHLELETRLTELHSYFIQHFPSINIQSFQAWANSIFKTYAARFRNHKLLSTNESHRAMILGLHAAYILSQSNEFMTLKLNGISVLDPLEIRAMNGLKIPELEKQRRRPISKVKRTKTTHHHHPFPVSPVNLSIPHSSNLFPPV